MAQVIITIKIMPESPDVDLDAVLEESKKKVIEFGAEFGKSEIEPIAFGLKALKIILISEESKGSTDSLEESLLDIDGVQSAESVDVRRAIG